MRPTKIKHTDKRKMPPLAFLFSFLVMSTFVLRAKPEGCLIEDHPAEPCPETEYEAYINCLQHGRTKRSVCNEEPCNECNCAHCESTQCSEMCTNCCEDSVRTCDTSYCCYKKCHSRCNSGECRKNCRKSCHDGILEKKAAQTHDGNVQMPNITTVINLHNQINNTNIVDIPINITTSNTNNITLDKADLQLDVQSDQPAVTDSRGVEVDRKEVAVNQEVEKNCCQIVSPKRCVPQNEFPFMKCFHYRQKVCGSICEAPIMHTQTHQICDENPSGPPECHNQIIYIPQPQPKCTYLDNWPYVSCSVQNVDNTYNVGPYPYGQQPYQVPFGYNSPPYNMQTYPFMGMEDFYSIAKDVGNDVMLNDQATVHKEVMDFASENDISETIPIEINQDGLGVPIDPTLVQVKVQSKPTLTIKEAKKDP